MVATLSQSFRRKLQHLETLASARRCEPALASVRAEPTVMTRAGLTPDAWQKQVLESPAQRLLLLCGRQCGKSLAAASLALRTALLRPRSPILLLSPSMRQSGEIFRTIIDLFN